MRITDATITCLCPTDKGIWVGSADGMCGLLSTETVSKLLESSRAGPASGDIAGAMVAELTGPNLEPVLSVQVSGKAVVTASRDGVSRIYHPSL